MTFYVPSIYDGKLLREFIKEYCGVSHNLLVKMKKHPEGILLNGEKVTVRALLKEGDTVTLLTEDSASEINPFVEAIGEMPEILYEDEALLAVNKPSGMPTHTSHGHRDDSLSNRVCAYFEKKNIPFVFRAVNRLDKDTSGVVLIAKSAFYAAKLSAAQESGDFEKTYVALVEGKVEECGKIEGYIKRETKSIIKRSFSNHFSDGADYSLTEYERLSEGDGVSFVKIRLKTGRTHQIRVHFSSISAPVLGDTLYGIKSDDIERQALHAHSLAFTSPISGERLTLVARIPNDISEVMKKKGILNIEF